MDRALTGPGRTTRARSFHHGPFHGLGDVKNEGQLAKHLIRQRTRVGRAATGDRRSLLGPWAANHRTWLANGSLKGHSSFLKRLDGVWERKKVKATGMPAGAARAPKTTPSERKWFLLQGLNHSEGRRPQHSGRPGGCTIYFCRPDPWEHSTRPGLLP